MIRSLLCLLALNTTALAAQHSPFVGTWQLSFPLGARLENGRAVPMMGTGVLTVVAQADSLVGTLVMDPQEGIPEESAPRLVAKAGGGTAIFVSRSEITLLMNMEERKSVMISTWQLTVTGDRLEGTVTRKVEAFGDSPDQGALPPVTGVRRKD